MSKKRLAFPRSNTSKIPHRNHLMIRARHRVDCWETNSMLRVSYMSTTSPSFLTPKFMIPSLRLLLYYTDVYILCTHVYIIHWVYLETNSFQIFFHTIFLIMLFPLPQLPQHPVHPLATWIILPLSLKYKKSNQNMQWDKI